MKRTFTLILFLTLCMTLVLGQRRSSRRQAKNSVSVEFFGKSFLWGAIQNERYLYEDILGMGAGLGFANFERTPIQRDLPNGGLENGTLTEVAFSMPIYGFASLGRSRHRAYIPIGVTLLCGVEYQDYPGRQGGSFTIDPTPFVGAGYEYRADKWFLRIPIYILILGEDSGTFPPALPWAGISVGRRY